MAINKEYDDVQLDVKFTQASTRANLVSEENISVSFGKLAKWHEALVPSGGSSGQFLGWNSDGTAKWVSNPNSDTKVTDTVGTANTYYPAGLTGTSTATGTQVFDTSFKFIGTTGTTSAVGKAQLVLGNSTASGTANNKQGSLVVYGSTAYAHTIQGAPTAARTLTLPDKTGTFALTSDIPSVPTVNDAALTLKGAGTTVTTFTANASSPKSLDIVAGSNVTVTADATNAKISIASSHPTITKSTDTTSTASPGHGGTFTVVDSVTRESNGHVTKINTKTVTLPADSNTDTKVSQTFATAGNNRPLLMSYYKVGEDAGTAQVAYRNDALYFNPSNGVLRSPRLYLQTTGMPITINLDTLQPTAGENVNVFAVKYKNTDGTASHTVCPIGILGNSATGSSATVNSGVRLGSTNGTTIVGAGESGVTFAAAQAKYNDENLYFVADGSVYMYTSCSNDSTTVTGPWRVGGFTTGTSAITSGRVMITDGTAGGFKASDYTIEKSVPSDAKFSDTDTKVTSSANHYAPATVSGQDKSASATGATAAWSIDVVKGVTLNTDGKGHVTGISVTSGKIPANPVPSNNVTGSGTSGYLTKWNGTHTITNGPQLGSSTTTYLRNDGTWATPTNTTYSAGTGLSLSGTTFNHSNSVTAETTFNKSRFKYDAQGHITSSSYYVHTATGTGGTAGWIKIATMKILATYTNKAIMLTIAQRGASLPYRLLIRFANANSTDPNLSAFHLVSDEVTSVRAYMIKSATSTWDLYIWKHESYDSITITEFDAPYQVGDENISWTWTDVQTAASAITGGTEATKKVLSARKSLIYDDNETGLWYKFAEVTITDSNAHYSTTFLVSSRGEENVLSVPYTGMLAMHVMTGSTKTFIDGEFKWIFAGDEISPQDFVMTYTNTANTSCKVELWCRVSHPLGGYVFNIVEEHTRTDKETYTMTLYDQSGNGSANIPSATGTITSKLGRIKNAPGIYPVKGTQTATTASWTGNIDVSELYDGLTIAYYLPHTSASNVTLNLTLADGTTTGAIPCYYNNGSRIGTHYGAGSTVVLTYWSAATSGLSENRWTRCDYATTSANQTNTTTNAVYRVLFSTNANDTTQSGTTRKNMNLVYNPSTAALGIGVYAADSTDSKTGKLILGNSSNVYTHTINTDAFKSRSIAVTLNDADGIMGTDVLCYTGYENNTTDDTTTGTLNTISHFSNTVSFSGYLARFSYFTVLLCIGTGVTARTTVQISAVTGYQSYQLIWGGAPAQGGGNLCITSGLVNITDSSGTITLNFEKCTSYWQFSSSATPTVGTTPDIHVLKVYGHSIRSQGYH